MYEILVRFSRDYVNNIRSSSDTLDTWICYGNYTIEGSFIRINYDHDSNAKTPQRTIIFPSWAILSIQSKVNQNKVL